MAHPRNLEVVFTPEMFKYFENPEANVVVVDILRATSAICTAFKNDVSEMIPVPSLEEARKYKQQGYIVAAERDGNVLDFADFGNSPYNFTPERVKGKQVAYSTTNGTKAIHLARNSQMLIIGSFINLSAVANLLIEKGKDAKKVDMARQSLKKIKSQLADNSDIQSPQKPAQLTSDSNSKEKQQRIKQLEKQKEFLLRKLKSVNAQRIEAEQQLQRLRSSSSQGAPDTQKNNKNTTRQKRRKRDVRIHTVQRGDTLIGLSRKYYNTGDLWDELLDFNDNILNNKTELTPGMKIKIPEKQDLNP